MTQKGRSDNVKPLKIAKQGSVKTDPRRGASGIQRCEPAIWQRWITSLRRNGDVHECDLPGVLQRRELKGVGQIPAPNDRPGGCLRCERLHRDQFQTRASRRGRQRLLKVRTNLQCHLGMPQDFETANQFGESWLFSLARPGVLYDKGFL